MAKTKFRVNLDQINYLSQTYLTPKNIIIPFHYDKYDETMVKGVIEQQNYRYQIEFELDIIESHQFSYYVTITQLNLSGQRLQHPITYNDDNLAHLFKTYVIRS